MDARAQQRIHRRLRAALREQSRSSSRSLEWLRNHMHPYFFLTMAPEIEGLVRLAGGLEALGRNRKIDLVDRADELIRACLNLPGSVYDSLHELEGRSVSYAEITHSYRPLPGLDRELEIQRFQFGTRSHREVAEAGAAEIPGPLRAAVGRAAARLYPSFPRPELAEALRLLWLNHEAYVRISPPERVARVLWLYRQGCSHDGLYLDAESAEDVVHHRESRLLFSVGNPPERGFLAQVLEVLRRFELEVRRSYCVTLSTGIHPYLMATFYVTTWDGGLLHRDSERFAAIREELYNTQILSAASRTYADFVIPGKMTGVDASLVEAFTAFSHTNLAHADPDRFDLGEVRRAFHASPDIAAALVRAFRARFDPDEEDRDGRCARTLAEARDLAEGYNTGHRHLDEVRRTVFRTALLLVTRTLKTNFFVPEKHALAFRLDPDYLADLGAEATADLPPGRPFRVTFFFGRDGCGYHIGFSDIARGGWRTVVCESADDFLAAANTLFREAYVLAHTQHLKNKDIYEGGSKLVAVLDASAADTPERRTERLYKQQFGFLNAFLDLFVTDGNGRARHPRVLDYHGQEEPIELGPDENLHGPMIEWAASQSDRRGYVLGKGIISSKRVGINHKEYGVTSLGVMAFAEEALGALGVDPRRDAFDVTLTGGPNGDVAGNALRLLLQRCPRARIRVIVAGSGALFDPEGADREELGRLVLRANVDEFDPARLHPGGFLLLARQRRQDGLRELFRRLLRTPSGVEEQWVTADEFHREFDGLIFSVPADLFLPAGGRPETIDGETWPRAFGPGGKPLFRAVVEGANSFLTPTARTEMQRRGVLLFRDASANKCGVISSSYEIIANLLMSDEEFLAHKAEYVEDVLEILDRRARDEARLILSRHREAGGGKLYTDISAELSVEINAHYERFFQFFSARPGLLAQPAYRRVLLAHLPALVREQRWLRGRVRRLPAKYRCAMVAAELATTIVYRGGWERDLEHSLADYARRAFSA